MEELTILAVGFVCAACFLIGARVGQATVRGEPVKVLTSNPVKAVEDKRARKEAEMEQDRLSTILRNIDCYDGTGYGQEEVPRG